VPSLKIFFHGNCFDGAASSAVFADFYRTHIAKDASIAYRGMQHSAGDPFEGVAMDADDNACVDFRYTDSDRLTWWFDHHVSAFQPPQLRDHFETEASKQKFFDPTIKSCTQLIVDSVGSAYGYELPEQMNGLVHWAHVVDSAEFGSAKEAVDLSAPHMKLMTWLEHNRDEGRATELIELMGEQSLEELCANDWVRTPLAGILEQHERNIDLVGRRSQNEAGVVSYDLVVDGLMAPNKFISYHLFPDARYTVALTRINGGLKISVGFNPWSGKEREHNIAEICERYGGGGHPVVGAITFPIEELERMQKAYAEICTFLRAG